MSATVSVRPPVPIPPRIVLETIKRRRSSEVFPRPKTAPTTTVNVAIAMDNNYIAHSAAMMLSAMDTIDRSATIRFFVLTNKTVSNNDRKLLSALVSKGGCQVDFFDVDFSAFAWAPLNHEHISVVAYYRLILHKLLSSEVERVIYIDSDTIIVDSLLKLWNIDCSESPVAACPDEEGLTHSADLSLPSSHRYFNSGAMIFDLRSLRLSNVLDSAEEIYRSRREEIRFEDQDLLNIIFCGKVRYLPLKWNINNRLFAYAKDTASYDEREAFEAVSDPGIIHFTCRIKPWHANCANPLRGLYWYYRNKTVWREYPREYYSRIAADYVRTKFSRTRRQLNTWYRHVEANSVSEIAVRGIHARSASGGGNVGPAVAKAR